MNINSRTQTHGATANPMTCFEAFHKCNVENKGQFSFCMDRKKACEAGDITVKNTTQVQPAAEQQPATLKTASDEIAADITAQAVPANVIRSQTNGNASCYTINMEEKACEEQTATSCATLSNSFAVKEDCDACFTRYRQPMDQHMLTVYMTAQKVKTCKPFKRDSNQLTVCQQSVAEHDERAATLTYLNAQKEIDHIIAEAKSSGIPGCGNFSRIY